LVSVSANKHLITEIPDTTAVQNAVVCKDSYNTTLEM